MSKVLKLALAAAVLTGMVIAGSSALAATQSGGRIQVFVPNPEGTKAKILITGAIGDYGTTLEVNENGKVDANGSFQKITLKKGGFWVDTTALNKKFNTVQPKVNATNCSLLFTATAPTTVLKGSGAYKGISGAVNITSTFAGIAPRIKSGAKKGQCNLGENVNPLGAYEAITGVGNVKFS
jgi:hypothetical protein